MRRLFLLAVLIVGACGDDRSPGEAPARSSSALSQGPRVALLSTRPGATESELRLQPIGASAPSAAVARVRHAPDGEVRGAVLGGGVVVVADAERRRDPSFGAWLFRLEPGKPAQKLVDGVAHASRPLVTASDTVLVERGTPGPAPDAAAMEAGQLRTDEITVDEVNAQTGASRTVHSFSGYTAHLAGLLGDEVILYRVAHAHADLIAVRLDTGAVRPLLSTMPAFARDFSVDASDSSLVFTNHDAKGWVVWRLPLAGGAPQELARAGGMWVTPHALEGGGILLNDGRGATTLGATLPLDRPLGAGFDELYAEDSGWAVLAHHVPSNFSTPFAVQRATGSVSVLAAPAGTRIHIAGIVP